MSRGMIIYLAVVGGVTALLVLRVFLWLRASELRSLKNFKLQSATQPVHTDSPVDDPAAEAQEHVAEGIANRFSVVRKLIVPLILVLGGSAIALPFLEMVPAGTISVVVGAVTVVAGLALRPVIENAIAGLVISGSKLINVGDTLTIGDNYGTIEDITITHTTIKLWDWRRFVVSNSKMLQTEFINFSLHDQFVWAYVAFWVDYSADFDEVERLVVKAAEASDAFAGHEKPRFWLIDTSPDAVLCWGAAWADSPADGWRLKHDMRKSLLPALAARGWAPRIHRLSQSVEVREPHVG
jgi:small-conductance mechanosensitive channel